MLLAFVVLILYGYVIVSFQTGRIGISMAMNMFQTPSTLCVKSLSLVEQTMPWYMIQCTKRE
jgi:hypothetical protein